MSEQWEDFPKDVRLLTKADFQRVFDKAARSGNQYFLILGRSNGEKIARLGLIITKKCSARAVERNRIKRLIREVFRTSRKNLAGVDFVVLCRPEAVGKSNSLLSRVLSEHLEKVRFRLCGSS